MKKMQGGTHKWCPNCKNLRICTAVNPSQLGEASGQRLYKSEHSDVHWFRRGLICQTCSSMWLSAEIPENFLNELFELRNALSAIKSNAEAYIKESSKASKRLSKLSKSLSVLRALDFYQSQE